MNNLQQIDQTYFTAWEAGDFATIRALVATDVEFTGSMAHARGVEEFLDGLQGLGRVLTRIEVHTRMASHTDVITWFDLHSSVAPPAPTAKWTHFENGKMSRIRVVFDPRPVLAGLEAAAKAR